MVHDASSRQAEEQVQTHSQHYQATAAVVLDSSANGLDHGESLRNSGIAVASKARMMKEN
jgi:hypothetical protein